MFAEAAQMGWPAAVVLVALFAAIAFGIWADAKYRRQ